MNLQSLILVLCLHISNLTSTSASLIPRSPEPSGTPHANGAAASCITDGGANPDCGDAINNDLGGVSFENRRAKLVTAPWTYQAHQQSRRPINPNVAYRSLIYANNWVSKQWSVIETVAPLSTISVPYGIKITVLKQAGVQVDDLRMAWILRKMLAHTDSLNMAQELSADVVDDRQIKVCSVFFTLTVQLLNAASTSIGAPAPGTSRRWISANLSKRGSSPYGLDNSISTAVRRVGRLIVPPALEIKLLSSLTMLSSTALLEPQKPVYAIGPTGGLLIFATHVLGRHFINGSDVLEALVDMVEWEFETKIRNQFYTQAECAITKHYSNGERKVVGFLQIVMHTVEGVGTDTQ